MSGILEVQKGGEMVGYQPQAEVLGVPKSQDILDYLGQPPTLQTSPLTGG